jgi:hypothetical protein
MDVQVLSCQGTAYVASCSPRVIIKKAQDILNLLSFGGEHETNLFMLEEENFDAAFYELKSGMAGEIVQKFSNYHVRAVIVGSFESVRSKRFREFMAESNKGNQLRFMQEKDAALQWLIQ